MNRSNISRFIYFLTSILPKKRWLIIQTYPIWEDNGVAVYQYFKNRNLEKIIWLYPDKVDNVPFDITDNTVFAKRNSVKGIFYYALSKYVCFTHGLYFRKFPPNQIVVNLWHGMPLKKIGVEKGKGGLFANYTLSTSPLFSQDIATAFDIPLKSVREIGLPRNMRLSPADPASRKKLPVAADQQIFFWLPTFRKSMEGDIRVDGIDYGNAFNMPDFDIESFNAFLAANKITVLVKPHPMAQKIALSDQRNLKLIDDNWLYHRDLTLYETLSVTDCLISDISSVLVDYLLCGKPIILSFPDRNQYMQDRNGKFEVFMERLPGPMCSTQAELEAAILTVRSNASLFKENIEYLKQACHSALPENTLSDLELLLN